MIILIVVGSLLLVLASAIISSQFLVPYVPLVSPSPVTAGYIGYYAGIFSLFVIPILLIGKWLINFTFGYRSNPQFRKIMSGFWLVSFVAFLGTVLFSSKNYSKKGTYTETPIVASIDTSQLLEINFHSLKLEKDWIQLSLGPVKLENGNLYANNKGLDVRFSANDTTQIKINKSISTYGKSKSSAARSATYAKHDISIDGQSLDIDQFYQIDKGGKFRFQELTYDINLPIGTKVVFNKTNSRILNYSLHKHGPTYIYVMTKDGLVATDIKKES